MKIKGSELARSYYHRDLGGAPDRDLLTGEWADNDTFFVTDTYTLFILTPEEFEGFLEKWNGYSKTDNLPEEYDKTFSINAGFIDKDIYGQMNNFFNEPAKELVFHNQTISFEDEWKKLYHIFNEEAAVFRLDDKYVAINRKMLQSLFNMIYKSEIDDLTLKTADLGRPVQVWADDRALGLLMPINPDSIEDREFELSHIFENMV